MSLTLDVLPTAPLPPTFGELLERTRENIATFYVEHALGVAPPIATAFLDLSGHPDRHDRTRRVAGADESFSWSTDAYAWIVWPSGQGTAVHNGWVPPDGAMPWEEPGGSAPSAALARAARQASAVGRRWSVAVESSDAFADLASGMLAGSLAELTEGLVFSDDGAWPFDGTPMHAADFVRAYLRPSFTRDLHASERARRCVAELAAAAPVGAK